MRGQILFVTDGSVSSDAAGMAALNIASSLNLSLTAVFIVDQGWKNLLGDEWMSNAGTRIRFLNWFERDMINNIETVLKDFCKKANEKKIEVQTAVKLGKTEKVIIELTQEQETALLVLPNPHATAPAAAAGLNINLNGLSKKITCPIYIGPLK